jgi:hypothetical protein
MLIASRLYLIVLTLTNPEAPRTNYGIKLTCRRGDLKQIVVPKIMNLNQICTIHLLARQPVGSSL